MEVLDARGQWCPEAQEGGSGDSSGLSCGRCTELCSNTTPGSYEDELRSLAAALHKVESQLMAKETRVSQATLCFQYNITRYVEGQNLKITETH